MWRQGNNKCRKGEFKSQLEKRLWVTTLETNKQVSRGHNNSYHSCEMYLCRYVFHALGFYFARTAGFMNFIHLVKSQGCGQIRIQIFIFFACCQFCKEKRGRANFSNQILIPDKPLHSVQRLPHALPQCDFSWDFSL